MSSDEITNEQETIQRAKHETNFIVIGNTLAQNHNLSYEARGLLIDLLSRPSGWKANVSALQISGKAGRDKVKRIIAELIKHGYVIDKERKQDEDGKFFYTPYIVKEQPLTGNPLTGKPSTVNQPLKRKEEESTLEPKGSSETEKSSAVNSKKKETVPAAQMNPMKDAIVAAFGWQTETVANWGAINKTAKELCSAGYTPDNVAGIYAHVKALPYIKDFTPVALSKYAADWKSKQNNNGQRMSLFEEAVEEQRARLAAIQGGQA